MKKEQETEVLSSEKNIDEARELLNFSRNFADEEGRFPTQEEISMQSYEIVRYFGSFEAMLRAARLGKESFSLRKPGKRRYCRYCGELLPQYRWFFCPPIEHGEDTKRFNHSCEEKFAERDDKILAEASKEIKKLIEKPKRKVWHKCRECGEKCKIYLPVPLKEPKAKIVCRISPEYEAVKKMLIKEMEGKQKLVIPKIE